MPTLPELQRSGPDSLGQRFGSHDVQPSGLDATRCRRLIQTAVQKQSKGHGLNRSCLFGVYTRISLKSWANPNGDPNEKN
jgi:hypothetical protein